MTARIVMKMRVARAEATTPEVLHLRLQHPTRPQLPAWTPGAHVDVRAGDGRIRQYSLCGDPADLAGYEIAIKREEAGRGGSAWAHASLRAGTEVHVSAPRNNFPLVEGARDTILVAGGIGITPLMAMARELARAEAPFHLHFCARSAADAPMLATVAALCGPRLTTWFSADGERFDPVVLGPARDGAHVYVCGPSGLIASVRAHGEAAGWPGDHIHAEVFAPLLDETFKPEPFDVRLASTGEVVHIPADRSILDVLRERGRALPSSCELGVCGSCICAYRDGTVLHRDVVIPLAERQNRIAICVSRARVGVTLDL